MFRKKVAHLFLNISSQLLAHLLIFSESFIKFSKNCERYIKTLWNFVVTPYLWFLNVSYCLASVVFCVLIQSVLYWLHLLWFIRVCSKLSEYGVQRSSDGSVSVSDSVLVKVSGADEDSEKEVLVSWSLQVIKLNFAAVTNNNASCCWTCSALTLLVGLPACENEGYHLGIWSIMELIQEIRLVNQKWK